MDRSILDYHSSDPYRRIDLELEDSSLYPCIPFLAKPANQKLRLLYGKNLSLLKKCLVEPWLNEGNCNENCWLSWEVKEKQEKWVASNFEDLHHVGFYHVGRAIPPLCETQRAPYLPWVRKTRDHGLDFMSLESLNKDEQVGKTAQDGESISQSLLPRVIQAVIVKRANEMWLKGS